MSFLAASLSSAAFFSSSVSSAKRSISSSSSASAPAVAGAYTQLMESLKPEHLANVIEMRDKSKIKAP